MSKKKEMMKEEEKRALDVQFKAIMLMALFLFSGIIFRQFEGILFLVLRYLCFACMAGTIIFLRIYNQRRKNQ